VSWAQKRDVYGGGAACVDDWYPTYLTSQRLIKLPPRRRQPSLGWTSLPYTLLGCSTNRDLLSIQTAAPVKTPKGGTSSTLDDIFSDQHTRRDFLHISIDQQNVA